MRVSAVVICVLLATRADADRAQSDAAAAAANAAAAKNDFATAAAKFREAYAADPRPALMCNVGIAYYKGGNLPRAERYLDECTSIGKALEKAFLDNVGKVYAAVSQKLAAGAFTPVDLTVEPTSASTTVEGGMPFDETIVGNHRLWFPSGTYRLTIHAEGFVDQQVPLVANGHAAMPLQITLVRTPVVSAGSDSGSGSTAGSAAGSRSAAGSGAGSDAVSGSGSGSGSDSTTPTLLHQITSSSALPVYVAAATTIVLGATSAGLWFVARSEADSAGTEQDPNSYANKVEQARAFQHWSWYAAGGAGVAAIVTGVLYWRYRSSAHVEVTASGSGAGIALTGAW